MKVLYTLIFIRKQFISNQYWAAEIISNFQSSTFLAKQPLLSKNISWILTKP